MSKNRICRFSRLRSWTSQVVLWIARGLQYTILYVLLAAILFAIVYFDVAIANCKEQDIRLVGLLLQVVGFTIVVLQLVTRRRLFRKPSLVARLAAYLKRFPSLSAKTVIIGGHVGAVVGTTAARLRVKSGAETSLEQRMEILESEVEELIENLRKVSSALSDHKAECGRSFDEVRQEMTAANSRLEELIDEAVVGRIELEWIGVLYFIVGISLATASSEVSTYLGFLEQCGLPVG